MNQLSAAQQGFKPQAAYTPVSSMPETIIVEQTVQAAPIANGVSSPWVPYELSSLEVPAFQFTPNAFYKCRYALVRFFQKTWFRFWGVDYTFGGMFYVLGFWGLIIGLMFATYKDAKDSGNIACIPLILTFSLAAHNSIWTWLFGVSFERVLIIHKHLGVLAVAAGGFHGGYSYFRLNEEENAWSGLVLFILIATMLVNSFFIFRKYCYHLFFWSHLLTTIPIIVFVAIHGAGLVFIGIGIWAFDVLVRMLLMAYYSSKAKTAKLQLIRPDVARIAFDNTEKKLRYRPGQYVILMVPKVSVFEMHPFSICSAPYQRAATILVKGLGDWSNKLCKLAQNPQDIKIVMHGPYGTFSIDYENPAYKIFIFIAGGIGVTPMKSACQHLLDQHRRGRPLIKVFFVWSVKEVELANAVLSEQDDIFREYFERRIVSNVLDSRIFVTRTENMSPLPPTVTAGRPPLTNIFSECRSLAAQQQQSRVAVFCCGPEEMISQAGSLCRSYACDKSVTFDYHCEVFEY